MQLYVEFVQRGEMPSPIDERQVDVVRSLFQTSCPWVELRAEYTARGGDAS